MAGDALWYEAAQVVGVTNARSVVAGALGGAADLLPPLDEAGAGDAVGALFAEIRAFYGGAPVPLPFRLMAHDPTYAADVWRAVARAFSDNRLARRLKEAVAFAVSLTSGSRFGAAFHLAEMRRLGVGPPGMLEVLGVAQFFSSYTKIADTLELEPDMGDIAPVDRSPAPGGRAVAAPARAAGRGQKRQSPRKRALSVRKSRRRSTRA